MNFKITLAVIGLVIVASTIWLNTKMEQTASQEIRVSSTQLPDYYMTDFIIRGKDVGGLPKFQLAAVRMKHYPYDDHSDLVKPKMLFYTQDGPPWNVESETGRINNVKYQSGLKNLTSKRITLYGRVTIIQPKSDKGPEVKIHTRDLKYEPTTNYLSTDNSVEYQSGANKIKGVGLRANLKDGFIRILNKSRARYEPAKK